MAFCRILRARAMSPESADFWADSRRDLFLSSLLPNKPMT
jgi:hypothetical protein